jgi:DNA-binding transcriptional LysR family regulator
MIPNPAQAAYRVPTVLRDLVLVDLMELTDSTESAGRLLNMSQPNASRRYRRLAAELGVQPNKHVPPGRRFSDTDWMRLLRQGANRHRLERGVLRIGGPHALTPWVHRWSWAEWIPLPPRTLAHCEALLDHELLDGVVLDAALVRSHNRDRLLRIPVREDQPLWLWCRRDPCVEAIARQQFRRLRG